MTWRNGFDEDGDLTQLNDMTVGIIGYGHQARYQALNMRNNAIQIFIGVGFSSFVPVYQDGTDSASKVMIALRKR